MKIIVAILLTVLLTGCATTYSKKEQLILEVPEEFLVPPTDLREL